MAVHNVLRDLYDGAGAELPSERYLWTRLGPVHSGHPSVACISFESPTEAEAWGHGCVPDRSLVSSRPWARGFRHDSR